MSEQMNELAAIQRELLERQTQTEPDIAAITAANREALYMTAEEIPAGCSEEEWELASLLAKKDGFVSLWAPEKSYRNWFIRMARAILAERKRCASIAARWALAGTWEPRPVAYGIWQEILGDSDEVAKETRK